MTVDATTFRGIIARSTVCRLTVAELNIKVKAEKQKLFLRILHKRIGTSKILGGKGVPSNRKENVEPYEDDEEACEHVTEIEVTSDNNKEINHNTFSRGSFF